jgi:tetratricopeptide (TPR) repeat protein
MVINRPPSRHPRQGPSCLLLLGFLFGILASAYIIANGETVRDAITPDPTPVPTRSAATYAAKASLQERDGDLPAAVESYRAAAELDDDNVEYMIPLIRLLLRVGNPKEAVLWAEQAATLSENSETYTLWAATLLEQGDRLAQVDDDVDVKVIYQQAVNLATDALVFDSSNGEAYAIRAGAYVRVGPEWFENAQVDIEFAEQLSPTSANVHRHAATVWEYQGYYDNAIEQYEIALDLEPAVDLYIGLARQYFFAKGSNQAAILTYREAIEFDDSSADAYDGLGLLYLLVGEHQKAEENFLAAVERDPEMVRAWAHLGAARFRQQNYGTSASETGAIYYLEKAIASYGEPIPANASYFNMLGLAYFYTEQNCEAARPYFDAVLEVVPEGLEADNANFGLDLCFQLELES